MGLQYAHKTDAFASTPMWARDASLALQLVPRKGGVFLDLGCGTGRLISLVQSTAQYERIAGRGLMPPRKTCAWPENSSA